MSHFLRTDKTTLKEVQFSFKNKNLENAKYKNKYKHITTRKQMSNTYERIYGNTQKQSML